MYKSYGIHILHLVVIMPPCSTYFTFNPLVFLYICPLPPFMDKIFSKVFQRALIRKWLSSKSNTNLSKVLPSFVEK